VPLLEPRSGAVLQLYGRSISGSRHLYLKGELRGLVNGARAMAGEDLVLVESILDALSLLALGVPNVVPIYGVNGWTRDHDRLLEEAVVKSVTLLLDSDPAGKRAADALGARLLQRGLRVRVANLEEHKDPNEALVAGLTADEMRQVLDEAVPLGPQPPPAETPAPARSTLRYELEEVEGSILVTFGARRYRVRPLAGLGLKQLGAMRLKLEDAYGSYLDTLDLGVARARRGFARNAARRFGAGEEAIEGELDALVEVVEGWIAAKAKGDESAKAEPPVLSDGERSEALAFLRAPKLLERSVEAMTRLGYVGEETNKALGYLVVVSRKLEDPLSVLVLSQSGAGKSGLTEVLERLTPPEDVVLYSRLTTNALYYMPKDFLRRKVVIIEERSGSEEADYSLRTLQSRKKLILGVPVKDPRTGRTETKTIEVEGPAVFLQTSTATEVNYENSTRCFELYLDESVEQTRRIHAQQRRSKTLEGQQEAGEVEALVRLHWNAQRLLEPVRVAIPFVDAITFPDAWLRTRRDHLRFLNLVEASAFLHQHQRPKPKGTERVIQATVEDYRIAYGLAREVLGSTLADLKKPARDLLEAMRAVLAEIGREKELPFERVAVTRRELRERTGLPDHQVRRLLAELVALEHVVLVNGSQGRLCSYRLADGGEKAPAAVLRGLLTPDDLERKLRPRT
jgi:5S rRNA maturation endonuclease (ribonuclease M5)